MAVLFFDTSALVRRYDQAEPGAARVRALCRRRARHVLLIARITPIEVAAALNRKVREGRFGNSRRDQIWRLFRIHWRSQYRVIAPDEPTWQRAEQLPFVYRLRGYDAIQLASTLRVRALLAGLAPDYRFCTADRVQAEAAAQEGLVVEFIS